MLMQTPPRASPADRSRRSTFTRRATNTRKTTRWQKFKLLMWKNFLLHLREKVSTLTEILIPPFFMLLVVGLRSIVSVHQVTTNTIYQPLDIDNFQQINSKLTNPNESKSFDIVEAFETGWRGTNLKILKNLPNFSKSSYNPVIAYSPKSDAIDNLLQGVAEKMNMKLSVFSTASELNSYLITNNTYVGIEFPSSFSGLTTLPKHLKYTLRYPGQMRAQMGFENNWRTYMLFSKFPNGGYLYPNDDDGGPSPGYYREGFLTIQNMIFKAYVKALNNAATIPKVLLQRFPCPPFTEDTFILGLMEYLPTATILAFTYPCMNIVKMVLYEKEKQIKEAMKIMGMNNGLLWISWFVKCLVVKVFSVGFVVLMLKSPWYNLDDVSILTNSDWTVIWLFYFIYSMAVITFSFLLSTFFTQANTGGAFACIIWYFAFAPYAIMNQDYKSLTLADKIGASLSLNSAVGFGIRIIAFHEGTLEGSQWSNLFEKSKIYDDISLGDVMIVMLCNTILYMILALYVEQVHPGDFGLPQPWNFMFKKSFWFGIEYETEKDSRVVEDGIERDHEPTDKKIGIQIKGLRKIYANKKVAVEGLNLNMYEGEITALLGHNGAGKTTTMSMLTGMIPPTSGTAIIGGLDIRYEMNKIRNLLGYCPQHNILFDQLTVREHIIFYSKLKGLPQEFVDEEVEKYVRILELTDKVNVESRKLSGGMQRKLCVGIATCADSKIVLCDEPTSGMDPAARRALWDLLLLEKKGRTLILSTHFMDEADILGDRISIMAEGKLKAVGSSFFLKKKYGAGYRLICVKGFGCNSEMITKILQSHISSINIESDIGSELSYQLHEENSSKFPAMLSELENKKEALNILDIGISLTTLEEVFMKVGKDPSKIEEKVEKKDKNLNIETNLLQGKHLIFNQIEALFWKKIYQTIRNWFTLLVQVTIPIIFVAVTITVVRAWIGGKDMPRIELKSEQYSPVVGLIDFPVQESSEWNHKFALNYESLLPLKKINGKMVDFFIDLFKHDKLGSRRTYLVGASVEGDTATAWFNNQAYHARPIALNLLHVAILRTIMDSSEYNIEVANHPLPYPPQIKFQMIRIGNQLGFQLAYNTSFGMTFVSACFVIFYIKERVTKAKLLQFVSGVNRLAYWVTGFLWDYLMFLLVCLIVVGVIACFQESGFAKFEENLRLYTILVVTGLPSLPIAYIASLYYNVPQAAFIKLSIIYLVTGPAAFIFIFTIGTEQYNYAELSEDLSNGFVVFPHFTLGDAIVNLNIQTIFKDVCELNSAAEQCRKEVEYFQWERPGIGRHLVLSILLFFVYFGILLLLDYGLIKWTYFKIKERYYRGRNIIIRPDTTEIDSDVKKEREVVNKMTKDAIKDSTLVARDMTKYYDGFLAVNQLSFTVNHNECFGLLGANGAGKTTTFKMLSGDISISRGDAYVNGFNLRTELKMVHKQIGYCPQFDALIDDLTGRETLNIFALLRGVPKKEIRALITSLSEELGFTKHIDKQIKEYSGGNKRKMSTAVAMLGNPSILYLDEPTTGMDPGARRNLWNVLCKVRDCGKTIILTSHSMEECEALCTRLAIMVNGEFKCLGSTQHLKNKFSKGFILILKVKRDEEDVDLEQKEILEVKLFVASNFPGAKLKEQYQGLLTYYITSPGIRWSEIFGIMEKGKKTLSIEDYSIGQTSLEQVFLSFTKYQRSEG